MKKVYLMKSMTAMAFGVLVASCNKTDLFNADAEQNAKQQEFTENFQKTVMNGKSIDSNQNWSTVSNATVTVNLNLDYGESYNVFIYTDDPVSNKDAAYIGTATITSGSSKSITVAKPNDVDILYAGVYNTRTRHLFAKPFVVNNNQADVSFGSATSKRAARRASEGKSYTVTTIAAPDITDYITGTTVITGTTSEIEPATKLEIDGNVTAYIPTLQSGNGISLYVKGTWTLAQDQRVNGNCKVIVANGGKIVIPDGMVLHTNANNEQNTVGEIFVLAGGSITGTNGTVDLHNGGFFYNAGSVDVNMLDINGVTAYNANGASLLANDLRGGGSNSLLINRGYAHIGHAGPSVDGTTVTENAVGGYASGYAGLQVENACQLIVDNTLSLGNKSKIDASGYIECKDLYAVGAAGSDIHLEMGPNSILKIKNGISLNNYGIWGPLGSETEDYAFVDIQKCHYVNYPQGGNNFFYTQIVNNIEVIYPANMDNNGIQYIIGGVTAGSWFGLTPSADQQAAKTANSADYSVPSDECTKGINTKDPDDDEGSTTPSYIYYAFEDLGTTDDFDFNDVVLRVSAPNANGESTIELVATGGTMPTYITYNGVRANEKEVHELIGATSVTDMVNTGRGSQKDFVEVKTITGLSATTEMDKLPIGINITGNNGQVINVTRTAAEPGKAPLVVVVSGDENGKWFWPTERTKISDAYEQFGEWGANASTNEDWYKNATSGKVFTW